MTTKEAHEILEKYIRCSNNECPPVDCDECQDHVTAKQLDDALQVAMDALEEPEQKDVEFWRGRAKEYRKCFFGLHDKVMQGFVADAINLNENGMTLKMKKSSARIQPDVKIITSHLKRRLWETALNNADITGDLSDAYADVAEHRLDAWMNEITGMEDKTETKWIPCSERLPVLDEAVLATTAWNDITIAWREGIDEWRIHEGNTNAETDDLIAWLPLPEPYKPQQEDNT